MLEASKHYIIMIFLYVKHVRHETVTEKKAPLGLKCQSLTLIGNQLDELHSRQGNLHASFPGLSKFNDTDFPWLDFCRNCFRLVH